MVFGVKHEEARGRKNPHLGVDMTLDLYTEYFRQVIGMTQMQKITGLIFCLIALRFVTFLQNKTPFY